MTQFRDSASSPIERGAGGPAGAMRGVGVDNHLAAPRHNVDTKLKSTKSRYMLNGVGLGKGVSIGAGMAIRGTRLDKR